MAGLVGGLLFGHGHDALLRALARSKLPAIVTDTGHLAPDVMHAAANANFKTRVVHMLLGNRPLEQLRQRMLQGGLIGKGGLIRGGFAMNPEMVADYYGKGPNPGGSGLLHAVRHHKGDALSAAVNLGFLAGIPAYGGYKAIERGDRRELANAVGNLVTWPIISPAMGPAGSPLGFAGVKMIENFLTPRLPQLPALRGPTPETMQGVSAGMY